MAGSPANRSNVLGVDGEVRGGFGHLNPSCLCATANLDSALLVCYPDETGVDVTALRWRVLPADASAQGGAVRRPSLVVGRGRLRGRRGVAGGRAGEQLVDAQLVRLVGGHALDEGGLLLPRNQGVVVQHR
jgi:hypothetical protein